MEDQEEDETRIFNEEEKDVLYEAMKEAQKAFDESIEEHFDPSYFELDMTGFVLSPYDLSKQSKMEFGEVKNENGDSDENDM